MAFSMSPKENYLACLNHKPHEYTPGMPDMGMAGMFLPFERGEGGAGTDVFGVRWVAPYSGGLGAALPAPGEFLLTDITKWKEVVQMPYDALKNFDWEAGAAAELAFINRDTTSVDVSVLNSIYERLASLMGFEEALLAMITEPEATYELLSALTDWKIEMIKYLAKYFKPDTYAHFDDVATERMLFMSPQTYRDMIKPLHTKIAHACIDEGIIPIQHTCGKADVIVQDMIDEGHAGWNAVQSTNDIEDIIEKHGDEFVIIGGYNSNAGPGLPTATEAEVRAEVRRCMDTYGKYGKGYIFMGFVLTAFDPDAPPANDMFGSPLNGFIVDEFLKIRAEQAK